MSPRAVGSRIDFEAVPIAVQQWVADALGDSVAQAETQQGGMSPGCAARLITRRGRRAFVKAVGVELNARTPDLFRHEISVLSQLPSSPTWPCLLSSYDDGGWVGLLLDDVDGRHPDFTSPRDAELVVTTVEDLLEKLTPSPLPAGTTPTIQQTAERWAKRWDEISEDPQRYLPAWAASEFANLHARVQSLPTQLDGLTLCHFDLRDDNLLIASGDRLVVLDWGMSRTGPAWVDLILVALQHLPDAAFDARGHEIARAHDVGDRTITDFLMAFGGSQAWNAAQPPRPGLPTMAEFCRRDSEQLLAHAARRLRAEQ